MFEGAGETRVESREARSWRVDGERRGRVEERERPPFRLIKNDSRAASCGQQDVIRVAAVARAAGEAGRWRVISRAAEELEAASTDEQARTLKSIRGEWQGATDLMAVHEVGRESLLRRRLVKAAGRETWEARCASS